MKISIWQQFSSNHSASFTLVGMFPSDEEAVRVAEEIQHIIESIAQWWAQYDNKTQHKIEKQLDSTKQFTPPESAFSSKYQVDWRRLDWIPADVELSTEAVRVSNRVVFVENIGNTWIGPHPFDHILRLHNGRVVCDCDLDEEHYLALNVTCLVPDEAAVATILKITTRDHKLPQNRIWFPGLGNATTGRIYQDGDRLTIENVQLRFAGIRLKTYQVFETIITFLHSHACTDIEYEFVEVSVE